jgi:3-hydroxyisobutyrate dehydrogenase-like beta-hydroxyacid dehydrogenase
MGGGLARTWTAAGQGVAWASEGRSAATRQRAEQAGATDLGTVAGVAGACDLVISVCPPQFALDVASQVGASGFAGIYVDANAIAPATGRVVEAAVGRARFVDGGIIGPPPTQPGTTRLYLSGPDAVEVSARLATVELEVHVVSEQIGAASAVKLAYAAWTKGTAALLLAIRAAARAEDVEAALLEEWRTSQPALTERSLGAARSGQAKGWRWVAEMQEIAAMFESVGLPGGFHHAAADIFGDLPWQP